MLGNAEQIPEAMGKILSCKVIWVYFHLIENINLELEVIGEGTGVDMKLQ